MELILWSDSTRNDVELRLAGNVRRLYIYIYNAAFTNRTSNNTVNSITANPLGRRQTVITHSPLADKIDRVLSVSPRGPVTSAFTLDDVESFVDDRERTAGIEFSRVGYEISELVFQIVLGLAAFGLDVYCCSDEKLVAARPEIIRTVRLYPNALVVFERSRA